LDGVAITAPAVSTFDIKDGVGGVTPYQDINGVWQFPDQDGLVNGKAVANWTVDSQFAHCGTITLTATGLSSGESAQTTFTDAMTVTQQATAQSTTSGTTLQTNLTSAVGTGNTMIVVVAMDPDAGTVRVTDAAGNTYTKDADKANGSTTTGVRTLVFSAPVTTALSSGDAVTVTFQNAVVS